MSNLNQAIKEASAESVLQVIEWAKKVHEDTMNRLEGRQPVDMLGSPFTVYEREEARKIILEYGVGKPTRIVEHRGSKKAPICFNTVIVPTTKALPEPYIDAEVVQDGPDHT